MGDRREGDTEILENHPSEQVPVSPRLCTSVAKALQMLEYEYGDHYFWSLIV